MEKLRRLKLYSEKDYGETIDFPVELIGRDGVVRRYSYAESIRIYERRIESAHLRYTDRDVIDAEIYHCSRRLEQIKRSWRLRMSASERQYVEGHPIPKDRELFDMGKLFLRAYLSGLVPALGDRIDLLALNLVSLQERSDSEVFYVNCPVLQPGTLLYVFRLSVPHAEDDPYEFYRYVELLKSAEPASDTEKLVHAEAQGALGYLITCPRPDALVRISDPALLGSDSEPVAEPELMEWLEILLANASEVEEGPFRDAIEELRHANLDAAFEHFKQALDQSPYYRDAYWALAALGGHLNRQTEVEPYLEMVLRYFPDEALTHYFVGLAAFKRRQYPAALESLDHACRLPRPPARAFGFLACTRALLGRWELARDAIRKGRALHPHDQGLSRLEPLVTAVLRWEMWGRPILFLLLIMALGAALKVGGAWVWGGAILSIAGGALIQLRQSSDLRGRLLRWARANG